MALPSSLFEADLRAVFSDISQKVTYMGEEIDTASTVISKANELEMMGIYSDYAVSFHIIKSDLTTLPSLQDKVTHEGVDYRVSQIIEDPSGVAQQWVCTEETG